MKLPKFNDKANIVGVVRAQWASISSVTTGVAGLALGAYADPVKDRVRAFGSALAAFWGANMGVSLLLVGLAAACVLLLFFVGYQKDRSKKLQELAELLKPPTITHVSRPVLHWTKTLLNCTFRVQNRHPQVSIVVMRVENVALSAGSAHITFPTNDAHRDQSVPAMGNIFYDLSSTIGADAASVIAHWREKIPASFTLSISLRVRRDTDDAGRSEIVTSQFTLGMPPWLSADT